MDSPTPNQTATPSTTNQPPQTPPNPEVKPFAQPPAEAGEKRVMPMHVLPEVWAETQRELIEARAFRAQIEAKAAVEEQERLKALAAKGHAEEALKQFQQAYEQKLATEQAARHDIEQRWLEEKRNAVLAEATAGLRFAGADPKATAAMVRSLLERDVEAVRDTQGNPIVRDRQTFRPAIDYLKERLASPEFALFLEANTRGGAGNGGAQFPANQNINGTPNGITPKEIQARIKQQYAQANSR